MSSGDSNPRQTSKRTFPAFIADVALVGQLLLAIAVGGIVVANLAGAPMATAPGALCYLAWCASILRQLAGHEPESIAQDPNRADTGHTPAKGGLES